MSMAEAGLKVFRRIRWATKRRLPNETVDALVVLCIRSTRARQYSKSIETVLYTALAPIVASIVEICFPGTEEREL